jgi:YjbE family integral membrane protein
MMEILRGYFADFHPQFWASVVEIIWINVLLSGDNALVIALACRTLPRRQRLVGMVLGTAAAIILRLAFAGVVAKLMVIPYLKIAGGAALLWIATKLLMNGDGDNGSEPETSPSRNLLDAVKAIAIADVVMSLDNVIAVVAAADGNFALIVFGLGMSIPLIVAGATIIMTVLNYVPALAWVGAAMLGWIAGDVIATDAVVVQYASTLGSAMHENIRLTFSIVGVLGTLLAATLLRARQAREVASEQSPGR